MPIIAKDSTGNVASLMIYDSAGAPMTGVAHDAAGLLVKSSIRGGVAAAVTVNVGTWTEKDYGQYEVDLADALFDAIRIVEIIGVITGGVVVGETLQVAELLAEPTGGIASIEKQDATHAEVIKIPRKGYQVTGENVTPGGDYLGEEEIVAYTEVAVTP